jgi:hypothetical protein
LVFDFPKNQILVAVIPGQKAPRTFPGQKAPRTFPGLESAEDFTRLLALGEGKIVSGRNPKTILRCV